MTIRIKFNKNPPRVALRFFRWFCRPRLVKYIEGDLMEEYNERLKQYGKRKADIKFIIDVVFLLRPAIVRPLEGYRLSNPYPMYKSYFKIAWRTLWNHKSFSFINIFGLATGLATCALIMLYVMDEATYDKHHVDGDRLYRIAFETKGEKWMALPAPMAEGLKKDFPEVAVSTRLLRLSGAEKMLLKDEPSQKQFFETNAYYVDSTFFRIFTYEFKFGDVRTALNQPNSIILSEEVASRFYGNDNPVDKVLKVGMPFGEFDYTIKGVLKNTGKKSHIPAHLFLSMNNNDIGGWVKNLTNWATNNIFHTYVKLSPGSDAVAFESKLPDFLNRNGGADLKALGVSKNLFLQPLRDIYLYSNYGYEVAPNGSAKYLYIFTSIAVFLLLIACINFMNLSTARSETRAREVGMRKVIGAYRSSLVVQFLGESLLMSGLALAFTIVLIQLLLPAFNQLTDKSLSLMEQPAIFFWLTGLSIVTGLLSGLYPAFYLSSFKPISALKGKLRNTLSAAAIRQGLVIFQFTISIVLILGAVIIGQQMSYMNGINLGFEKNQKMILPLQTGESNANSIALKTELLKNTQIISAAKAATYPGIENIQDMLFYAEGKSMQDIVDIQTVFSGSGYIETLGIQLRQGRSFSEEFTSDTSALVLNETAVKQLGYTPENAVGRNVYFEWQNIKHSMNIIGVIKDFHFQSLHQEIKPLALTIFPLFGSSSNYLIADVRTSDYAALIGALHDSWVKINPHSPFVYSFLDQDFQKNYEKEERTSTLIRIFTLIAVVIACLGLFGLATFTAEQRIKEIGIRKVLGSSVTQLVALLSVDILKLVMAAFVLSSPIAYFAMNKWLQGFAYRIGISWWVFPLAGLVAALMALLTVSFQALRAATANPVDSLRSE